MDAATWKAVNEVFEKALALPEEERSRWVREASGSSAEIAAEVLRLLAADGEASSFLEGSALAAEVTAEPVPPPFATGTVLKNRYEIRQLLGYGGMGHVFEAYDLDLKVSIAIKVLRDDLASQSTALENLRREVRTARMITHQNVCRTYDLDLAVVADASGELREVVFLTMELLKGETLAARIRRDGALPAPLVLEIAKQVAEGLETAHGSGVIHRDLKPGNIMLVPGDGSNAVPRAVLMDFGIARRDPLFHGDGTTSLSRVELAGTIAYMAPEQLDPSCKVTPAADQYAFGLVLFEMLTGRQAFPSSHFLAGIAERITGAVPSPRAINPAIPVVWERALQIALQPSPEARFASAADLVRAIESGKATSLRSATGSAVRRKVGGQKFQPAATSLYERATGLRQWWVAGFALALAAVSLLLANSRFHWWGAKADVEAGSLIYLAPVKNETTEKRLDGITEFLRASLSQSTQINLLDESRVGDTLERMAKAANTPMTDPLAREVALRTGAVRVVFGTVSGAKGNYRLDIRLEQPDPASPERSRGVWSQRFEWHAPEQESATIPEAMSTALRNAAGWVRKSAGESSASIAKLDTPLESVTTSDWQALNDYGLAKQLDREGRKDEAADLLAEATRRDPGFSSAWAFLGGISTALGRREAAFQAYRAALSTENESRLTRRERDAVKGDFATDSQDYQTAFEAFRDAAMFYENNRSAWFNQAFPLEMLDRPQEALAALNRAQSLAPEAGTELEMAFPYLLMGDRVNARRVVEDSSLRGSEEKRQYLRALLAVTEGDLKRGVEAISVMADPNGSDRSDIALVEKIQMLVEMGNLVAAGEAAEMGVKRYGSDTGSEVGALLLLERAWIAFQEKKPAEAIAAVRQALSRDSSPDVLIDAATVIGCNSTGLSAGDRVPLLEILAGMLAKVPSLPGVVSYDLARARIQGEIALLRGNPAAAINFFRTASALDSALASREYLARALTAQAMRDPAHATELRRQALGLYQEILQRPIRYWIQSWNLPCGYLAEHQREANKLLAELRAPPPSQKPQT